MKETSVHHLSLHGMPIELRLSEPALQVQLEKIFGPFSTDALPEGFVPTRGSVQPYDQSKVLKHLSSTAVRISSPREVIEIYQDGDKIWLIDDRWGMVQMDFKLAQWRSWIVAKPTVSTARCVEMAVLWPLAQLLRSRHLHLLPAASVVKNNWGALILSPFGLEPELSSLIAAGYKIVGQRWTALREEDGRLAMLHLPGRVEKTPGPRLRGSSEFDVPPSNWVDLMEDHPRALQHHAFCDLVLVTEPGRRQQSHFREMGFTAAVNILRRHWPIAELSPKRRQPQLPSQLAQRARCCELQLSRDPKELITILDTIRQTPAIRKINPLPAAPAAFRTRPPRRMAG